MRKKGPHGTWVSGDLSVEDSGQGLFTLPSSLCPYTIPDLDGFMTTEQRKQASYSCPR